MAELLERRVISAAAVHDDRLQADGAQQLDVVAERLLERRLRERAPPNLITQRVPANREM